jgi:hypothetical protein
MTFLISSPHTNYISAEFSFAHTDSEEIFNVNTKKYGKDWYYTNNPINYKFNNLGYRMKELEDVDYDNYFAFFGCSYTVGSGLKLEDTFVYKISQIANVDYINAAIGGSSVDFVYYNFIRLMYNAPKKPKVVFINWPCVYRSFYWENESPTFMLPNFKKNSQYWGKAYRDFLAMDSQVFNRFDIIRTSVKLICDLANIPLFEMSTWQDLAGDSFGDKYPDIITDIPLALSGDDTDVKILHLDRARDIIKVKNFIISHPGILHHDGITKRFFEVMK